MARARLKSLNSICRNANEVIETGLYLHIWVYSELKIGFRMPYKKYLGTEVRIIKQVDRRGNVVPQMYKVLNLAGKPIFSAHRTWFDFIEYENDREDLVLIPAGESSSDMPSIHDACRNDPHVYWVADEPEWQPEIKIEVNLSELSWDQLFDEV